MDANILMTSTVFHNTGQDYVIAFCIFVLISTTLYMVRSFLYNRLTALTKKTKNDLDDLVIDYLKKIHGPFYFFISLYVGSKYLTLPAFFDRVLNYMLMLFVIIYVILLLSIIIDYIAKKQIQKREADNGVEDSGLIKVLGMIVKGIIWIVAFLFVLSNLGINITSMVAGLGIGGIAIAFALQSILEDVFSSFSIYFDKPFKVGDFIVIGEDKGTVKHVGLKTTRIEHLNGNELVVSNKELTTTRIHNYKKMKKRRNQFTFGVTYDTPARKLRKIPGIVESIVNAQPKAELVRVHFKEFGDFSLNYEVIFYMNTKSYMQYMDAQQAINLALVEAFGKEKIEFAFPTQTVILQK